MNMIKNNGGFTLVELIVVIAILAILAGVAVPAYSGYINEANEAADNQLIEAVETAVSASLAMEGRDKADASKYFKFTLNEDTGVLTIDKADVTDGATEPADMSDVWDNFNSFYGSERTVTLKFYKDAIKVIVYGVTATKYVAPAAGGST